MTSATAPPAPGHGLRVAVVGSGLAGLTTAYLLRQRGVTVFLIEKSEKLGFHSSSIDIPTPDHDKDDEKAGGVQTGWTVDVPMRSFQGGYYPNLIALYRHLGLPLRAQQFTFSFSTHSESSSSLAHSTDGPFGTSSSSGAYFIHSGASGLSLPSLPASAYHLRRPWTFLLGVLTCVGYAGCYLLLLALSFLSYHSLLPCLFAGTLGDTVEQIAIFLWHPIPYTPLYTPLGRVWRSFIALIVVPLFSSVGTMPTAEVYSTPAKVILEYIHKTVGTDHYSLASGHSARTVADRLAEPVRAQGEGYLRLGTNITRIRRDSTSNKLRIRTGTAREEEEEIEVDKVILATPASVARTFLGMLQPSLDEAEGERVGRMKKALAGVRYKETIVVTHRDSSILPRDPGDVREINLVHPQPQPHSSTSSLSRQRERKNGDTPHFDPTDGYTQATHVILPPSGTGAVYQTTNPMVRIAEQGVLGVAQLERALPLRNPSKTIAGLHPADSADSGVVYLAGAYAWPGIPLLEGCVGSARRVVDTIVPLAHRHESSGTESTSTGDVDWSKGEGGIWGRAWRWRSGGGSVVSDGGNSRSRGLD